MGLEADKIGQLVDAFLPDHGGIHVREEQALAPPGRKLHHHIHRRAIKGGADLILQAVDGDVGGRVEMDLARHVGIKSDGLVRPGQNRAGGSHHLAGYGGVGGI